MEKKAVKTGPAGELIYGAEKAAGAFDKHYSSVDPALKADFRNAVAGPIRGVPPRR
jgi:hypothetical protein